MRSSTNWSASKSPCIMLVVTQDPTWSWCIPPLGEMIVQDIFFFEGGSRWKNCIQVICYLFRTGLRSLFFFGVCIVEIFTFPPQNPRHARYHVACLQETMVANTFPVFVEKKTCKVSIKPEHPAFKTILSKFAKCFLSGVAVPLSSSHVSPKLFWIFLFFPLFGDRKVVRAPKTKMLQTDPCKRAKYSAKAAAVWFHFTAVIGRVIQPGQLKNVCGDFVD